MRITYFAYLHIKFRKRFRNFYRWVDKLGSTKTSKAIDMALLYNQHEKTKLFAVECILQQHF